MIAMVAVTSPASDFIGPSRPIRFEERFGNVRAMQFNGTRESAAAIAARFPGRLAWSVEREGVLLVVATKPVSFEQIHEFAPGSWLVEVDRWRDFYAILSDRAFQGIYRASPYQGGVDG